MKKIMAVLVALTMILSFNCFAFAEGAAAEKTPMTAGSYEGSAAGLNGPVTVNVTVSEDAIEAIEVTAQQETPGIGAPLTEAGYEGDTPVASIPAAIVANQTLNVDAVSGATITSYAVRNAVKDALVKAGANVDEWQAEVAKTPAAFSEKTYDVVVVGGGGAGLAAAISAKQNGAETVLVLEKNGAVGGDTLVCGAIYNCPDEELQSQVVMSESTKSTVEAAIAKDAVSDEHKALQDMVAEEWNAYKASGSTTLFDSDHWYALQTFDGGDDVADLELVKALCYNAKAGYDWIKSLGMEFNNVIGQGAGSLWQRTHTSTKQMGTGFISTYVDCIAKMDGVDVMTSTTGKALITDAEGNVTGVTAEDVDGNAYTFTATKGVILATGGFAANSKMIAQYNTSDKWAATDLTKVKTTNRYSCSQGDGINMAIEAGAALSQMDQIQLLYLGNTKDGSLTKYPPRCVNGTDQEIFINKNGERFVQEDGRRDTICLAVLAQPDSMFYFLESADGDYTDVDTAMSADGFSLRSLEEQGYVYIADTLDEMAEKLGMNADTLKATVDAFNASVESGKDEFGRTLFSTQLTKGPWVATPRTACLHHTMGGVSIDTACRVLNGSGSAIKGLYAAGEITGGIHGANRLGGNAVVDTVVFGKLAGETVMADNK
ncbi:MAG: FAD-dependent oxidoreductase [Clostridiales bacterium]|nr:FAD-dependent oxidoreductase [Clostridiales bacterium]MDO4349213.1 FAD-dependent oxidoreductase [Eubacteriales bacterium]MDY4007738.1 FAD-dependent oxidoreductase [Candidatus Limiplasma sp.]